MNKSFKIIALLVIVFGVGVAYFSLKDPQGASSTLSGVAGDGVFGEQAGAPVAQEPQIAEIVGVLNTVNGISLDTKFLSDPVFSSLVDFSAELPPENLGKSNPFAQ